jgi:uncharacterized protein involved in exopolysaccharide biosynthesis/Mrp family chromosome partitioning ATPase
MSQSKPEPNPFKLNLDDILFILFKHKWMILLCSAIGIGAAAAVYLLYPTVYESQAKLLVRYVMDTSAIDQVESRAAAGPSTWNLINAEVEILKSWDLTMQVAGELGVQRLLSGSEGAIDVAAAAAGIRAGLEATPLDGTNVILVSFKNRDPRLVTLVLKELVARYFIKHLEIHRSADAFNFVAQQSDLVRARLSQTEEELRSLKSDVGITSLKESTTNLNAEQAKTREALEAAEADLAEQRARIAKIESLTDSLAASAGPVKKPTPGDVQLYQRLIARLDKWQETHLELLSRYAHAAPQPEIHAAHPGTTTGRSGSTPASINSLPYSDGEMAYQMARERYRRQNDTGFAYNRNKKNFDELVKEAELELLVKRSTKTQEDTASQSLLVGLHQEQMENLEKQRVDLETRFPGIASTVLDPSGAILDGSQDAAAQKLRSELLAEKARLAGIDARVEVLQSRLRELENRAKKLWAIGPRIEELERTKEIEETNYKYFQASLEKARVDEALDPSKMPNISVVQSPSTALRTTRNLKKIVLGLAGGGVALGLAFAFLVELVLNQTVKRPLDIEALLGVPPFLSIPYLNGRNPLRLLWPSRNGSLVAFYRKGRSAAPWESDHWIRPYSEAIRDRLVLYFEINRMKHKPKLVAITGFSQGAGSSTLAAGLAAALSETGGGKVLLVDMNVGRPEIHPFFRGGPVCSLSEALVGEPAQAGENLYIAVASAPESPRAQLVPTKFSELVPHLKASDFDYIIFDMPVLCQTSLTMTLSGLMDKVLVIIESEKSPRSFVARTYADLLSCRANASVIFNKVRSFGPHWLDAQG